MEGLLRDRGKEIGAPAGIDNLTRQPDPGIEECLRGGGCWTRYAGWNFNGRVCFDSGLFHCEVWVFGSPRETISAPTLTELMKTVSDKYGYE
jgi:hypothetical protein